MRLDVVFDRYFEKSIKGMTRDKRGTGLRQRVTEDVRVPANFMGFLRDSENKEELNHLLVTAGSQLLIPTSKDLFITSSSSVIHVGSNADMKEQCNHEEADSRIMVHLMNAIQQGTTSVKIRTGDTDVVVIVCGQYHRIDTVAIWIEFIASGKVTWINIAELCNSLGPMAKAMPMFHALTGCDVTASFRGKGKLSFANSLKKNPWFTDVSREVEQFKTVQEDSELFQAIQHFFIKVYSSTNEDGIHDINIFRKNSFCKGKRDMSQIPPTKDALLQHTQRSIFQASIWMSSHQSILPEVSPAEFGWRKNKEGKGWEPQWITKPTLANSAKALIQCACKTGCQTARCRCKREDIKCSNLCRCGCHE